jgi:hypothetical protein
MRVDEFVAEKEKEAKQHSRQLYEELMALLLGLVIVDGIVVYNEKNMAILARTDKAFDSFSRKYQKGFFSSILSYLKRSNGFHREYFADMGFASSMPGFDAFYATIENYFKRVGLLEPIRIQIKSYLFSAISSGRGLTDIREGLKNMLGFYGKSSILDRYYRGFVFDTVMQYDRVVANTHAESAGLKYFIYEGGLIETSREFCIKRDGLIFNKDLVDDWASDPALPATPGYIPLVHFGSYNCRHWAKWITDQEYEERQSNG